MPAFGDLALRFGQTGQRGKRFGDGLAIHLACQPVVRAVAGITGPAAMTVWISTTTTSSRNGARPHVTQLGDLQLHSGATAFQVNQRVGHVQPAVNLAYYYARFHATKKTRESSLPRRTPHSPLEDYLVETLVQADWNRRRYTRIEAQVIKVLLASQDAEAESPRDAFTGSAAQQVFRRLAATERSDFRALKELGVAQRERQTEEEGDAEAPAAACPPQPAAAPSPAPASSEAPRIGFVPPNPPQAPVSPLRRPVSPNRGAFRRF